MRGLDPCRAHFLELVRLLSGEAMAGEAADETSRARRVAALESAFDGCSTCETCAVVYRHLKAIQNYEPLPPTFPM